jgi:hypothetical protein
VTPWELGWWAPIPPALDPDDLIDPAMHGPLLAAAASGSPLDQLGRARLEGLRAAGLIWPQGATLRPRFPVVPAEGVAPVREVATSLGAAIARLLAGEWSRLAVEHEPVSAVVPSYAPVPGGRALASPGVAFGVVGGLLLDLGVRRLLRRQGLMAPPFGGAFVWLVEGAGAAGTWFARSTVLPGRGRLARFGQPGSAAWDDAGVDPEAAPALPAKLEPELLDLVEALGSPVARLVADTIPAFERARPRPDGEDPGADLAWAYSLSIDAALAGLAERGLVGFPPGGAVALRVTDPALIQS